MATINDYLKKITSAQKSEFERIRKIVKDEIPDVGETISYGMPTFTHNHKYVLYFGAFKNHMSLFPTSDDMIDDIGGTLRNYRTSRGTLRFTTEDPIPEPLLRKIIKHRIKTMSQW